MTVSIEHQADLADGYERESVYVEMQDGCRIAVDVLHPAKGGRRLDGEFPTVLRYRRFGSTRSFICRLSLLQSKIRRLRMGIDQIKATGPGESKLGISVQFKENGSFACVECESGPVEAIC